MAARASGPGRWLSGHFTVCLAVYDTRRGQAEGQEADKVLGFYPPSAPPAMQSSLVGLAQAATMFAATFNKECATHTMETDNNLWAMLNAEPGVWFLIIASRAWCGAAAGPGALESCLRTLHALAVLLGGAVNAQLDADPSGTAARARLQPLLQEAASRLLRSDAGDAARVSCPLAIRGGTPLLRVSRPAFAQLQALVNQQLVLGGGPSAGAGGPGAAGPGAAASVFGGGRAVHGLLACWGLHLLWSTLGAADTSAVFALACRGLLPAVRAGAKHRTMRRPLGPATAAGSSGGGGGSGSAAAAGGALAVGPHNLLNPAYWEALPSGLVQPVWPVAGASSSGVSSSSGNSGIGEGTAEYQAALLPAVWVQGGQERCRLYCYRSGPLVLLLLLSDAPPAALSAAAAAASRQLAERAPQLAVQLAGELPAKHIWHVPGLRYHFSDAQAGVQRATPLSKVSTLSLQSLVAVSEAQSVVDLEAAALADPSADSPLIDQGSGPLHSPGSAAHSMGGAHHDHHHHAHHQHHPHDHHPHSHGHHGHRHSHAHGHGHHAGPRRAVDPAAWAGFLAGGAAGDLEVALRAAHDCTVVARRCGLGGGGCGSGGVGSPGVSGGGGGGGGGAAAAAGGGGGCTERRIVAAAEGDKDRAGLPLVMGQVDALCDLVCPGVFDGIA